MEFLITDGTGFIGSRLADEPLTRGYPYPGSWSYARQWRVLDDLSWERATDYCLSRFGAFSDIHDARPLPLNEPDHR